MSTVKRRGESWQATYRGPDHRERSKTFAKKVDAERWVTDEVAKMNRGEWIDPRSGKTTFGEYAESWRVSQVHRPSTTVQVKTNLNKHVLPTFKDRPLSSIRTTEVQAWVKSLEDKDKLSPSTIELIYGYLATIFRAAVTDKMLATTPCVKIGLPKIEPHEVDPLATDVVQKLISSVPDRYQALITTAAGTGMRQGECFGLTLDRVNFLKRSIKVDQQLVLLPGAPPALAPLKTKASYRTIPLPQLVLDALAAHLVKYPTAPDGLIFRNKAESPMRRPQFSPIWKKAVGDAGAPADTGFHALRHYYASLLIRHGESVKTVQARLGHANAAETLDTYSHLWPDSEDRSRSAVDDAFAQNDADVTRTSVEEQG